jgi:nitrate/nitrite transporter NarK
MMFTSKISSAALLMLCILANHAARSDWYKAYLIFALFSGLSGTAFSVSTNTKEKRKAYYEHRDGYGVT